MASRDHQRLGLIKIAGHQIAGLILAEKRWCVVAIQRDARAACFRHLEGSKRQATIRQIGACFDHGVVGKDELSVAAFCVQIDMRCVAVFTVENLGQKCGLTKVAMGFADKQGNMPLTGGTVDQEIP